MGGATSSTRHASGAQAGATRGPTAGSGAAAPAPGTVWTHYKHTDAAPKRYEVMGVATHTEEAEAGAGLRLVVYRALYGERHLWARPLAMWGETVTVAQPWPAGKPVARQRFVMEVEVEVDAASAAGPGL